MNICSPADGGPESKVANVNAWSLKKHRAEAASRAPQSSLMDLPPWTSGARIASASRVRLSLTHVCSKEDQ
jgi:hypothetical protein